MWLHSIGFSDTIPSTTGGCVLTKATASASDSNPTDESFALSLANDTLYFSGLIRHNCCGDHFIVYNVSGDTINLSRLDKGRPCRCICLFPFSVKIPASNFKQYHVLLTSFSSYGIGIDTTISESVLAERQAKLSARSVSIECYPNPANNLARIILSGLLSPSGKISVYDISGRNVGELKWLGSFIWQLDASGMSAGTYFIQYKESERSYLSKLILNK